MIHGILCEIDVITLIIQTGKTMVVEELKSAIVGLIQ